MRCFIGIDLGSTTTKAVVIDEDRNVLGRGITNSRSNYDTAAAIAKQEALVNARFHLFRNALSSAGRAQRRPGGFPRASSSATSAWSSSWSNSPTWRPPAGAMPRARASATPPKSGPRRADEVFKRLQAEAPELFAPGAKRKSDFFRDIAGSRYLAIGETRGQGSGHALRHAAQRVRPLDHRGREPRLRRRHQPHLLARAGTHFRS